MEGNDQPINHLHFSKMINDLLKLKMLAYLEVEHMEFLFCWMIKGKCYQNVNTKLIYNLICALVEEDIHKVHVMSFAKEIWVRLALGYDI